MSANQKPRQGQSPRSLTTHEVRCRWLSNMDRVNTNDIEIVRILVQEGLSVDRAVLDSICLALPGSLIVTPAGTVTAPILSLPQRLTLPTLTDRLGELQTILEEEYDLLGGSGLTNEILLGLDGYVANRTVPLQSVAYLNGQSHLDLGNTIVKMYPAVHETGYLFGWRLCRQQGSLLPEFQANRVITTCVGRVAVFVCHESILFSNRSRCNIRNCLRREIRDFFDKIVASKPKYALFAIHRLDDNLRSGHGFIEAAQCLADSGITVITTAFAPRDSLDQVAGRFEVLGPNAPRVATLIVESCS